MPSLTEMLQASEVAIPVGGTYPWPAGARQAMNTANGLKLNGLRLTNRNTELVVPSAHSFLNSQYNTYSGFKVNGELIKWPKAGTQPYSNSVPYNLLTSLVGDIRPNTVKSISLSRLTTGTLRAYIPSSNSELLLGSPLYSSYATARRRDIQFIIIHVCGAGGGGGDGGLFANGGGGGSGAVAAWIVDMRHFTTQSLHLQIPSGGGSGEPAAQFLMWSISPTANGEIRVYGGTEGGYAATGDGKGGKKATYTDTLKNAFFTLIDEKGADASSVNGASLPVYGYSDPNPVAAYVQTSQSFNSSVGRGGKGGGGGFGSGSPGRPGAVYIYY